MHNHKLGRDFGWLWTAYGVSTFGTFFALNAYSYIAIRVLHSGTTQVSLLSAVGTAAGALLALPLGPWTEFRRKRPVMIAMDLVRFAAQLSLPLAYAMGVLSFAQLMGVAVIVSGANVVFKSASGANLKSLVHPSDLLVANARFESTTWTASVLGSSMSGVAIGIFGPVITVTGDAVSYLLSALGIGFIRAREPVPPPARGGFSVAEVMDGWRYIFGHRTLRLFFFNSVSVNSLIMVGAPVLAVLMLDDLRFTAWEYGLSFGIPCIGGLIGSRLARRLVARYGRQAVLLTAGTARTVWPIGLAFIGPGLPGLAEVIGIELGLIISCSVYNPPSATYRLEQSPPDRVSRVLSAWSITQNLAMALLTVAWGVLAEVTGPRVALFVAGILLLGTPLLLPRHLAPAPRDPLREREQRSGELGRRGRSVRVD
jgi:hypothetical protein